MTTVAACAHAVKNSLYLKQEQSNLIFCLFVLKQLDYKYILQVAYLRFHLLEDLLHLYVAG